jgi:hypothetical protein
MKHELRSDTALELSLSEISALSSRATRGAGRSWGEAEEAADAACWLARAGLDWADALLEVLDAPAANAECALRAGIALADGVALSGSPMSTGPHWINSPRFLLPFAARVADHTRQCIRLHAADVQVILSPGACPLILGAVDILGPAQVTVTSHLQKPPPCPDWPQSHRGSVRATEYARLTQLMMAFTVPTSAHSQAGAGAKGDDND